MEKYRRYYGIFAFVAIILVTALLCYKIVVPKVDALQALNDSIENRSNVLEQKTRDVATVKNKIKKIKDSIANAQKKIYSPVESQLGPDTLFFTLYNDLLEMVHANSMKIKSIDYTYNPETDEFVKFGKDVYFVCDINMQLISNYVNLGKLIQDIYQYPYYIKINNLVVKPYEKDKTVLISELSLRLYAHTSPEIDLDEKVMDAPMP